MRPLASGGDSFMNNPVSDVAAPDFYQYPSKPLSSAACEGEFVHLLWPDGAKLACHRFWLRENAVGDL